MGRKKKGKCVRNNKDRGGLEEPEEIARAPHTYVLHRGYPCPSIVDLTRDFRHIMEPFTASSLKERKSNKIKDFVSLSGVYHVSHMCIFYRSRNQMSLKICRLPRGPTLTFKINQFALARDVITASKRQYHEDGAFEHAPLVILNSFAGEGKHLKLMASTFQNLFPTINLTTVELNTIRRCVMLSYNPETKLVDLRHYAISLVPVGLTKNIKKVVLGKIPDLSKCDDISEFISQAQAMSDSEMEDETGHVVLPQKFKSRGNLEDNKSAVVLHELGPRITFQLTKIEDGLLNGEILFHEFYIKSEEENEKIRKLREKKLRLKDLRRKNQNENALKKEKEKADHKKKSMHKDVDETIDNEPENDADYYREEIGQEPDEDLFSASRTHSSRPYIPKYAKMNQKRKLDDIKKRDGSNKRQKMDNDNKNYKGEKKNYSKNSDFTEKKNFTKKPSSKPKSKSVKPKKKNKGHKRGIKKL